MLTSELYLSRDHNYTGRLRVVASGFLCCEYVSFFVTTSVACVALLVDNWESASGSKHIPAKNLSTLQWVLALLPVVFFDIASIATGMTLLLRHLRGLLSSEISLRVVQLVAFIARLLSLSSLISYLQFDVSYLAPLCFSIGGLVVEILLCASLRRVTIFLVRVLLFDVLVMSTVMMVTLKMAGVLPEYCPWDVVLWPLWVAVGAFGVLGVAAGFMIPREVPCRFGGAVLLMIGLLFGFCTKAAADLISGSTHPLMPIEAFVSCLWAAMMLLGLFAFLGAAAVAFPWLSADLDDDTLESPLASEDSDGAAPTSASPHCSARNLRDTLEKFGWSPEAFALASVDRKVFEGKRLPKGEVIPLVGDPDHLRPPRKGDLLPQDWKRLIKKDKKIRNISPLSDAKDTLQESGKGVKGALTSFVEMVKRTGESRSQNFCSCRLSSEPQSSDPSFQSLSCPSTNNISETASTGLQDSDTIHCEGNRSRESVRVIDLEEQAYHRSRRWWGRSRREEPLLASSLHPRVSSYSPSPPPPSSSLSRAAVPVADERTSSNQAAPVASWAEPCTICCGNLGEYVLLPCCHGGLCLRCARLCHYRDERCAMCRTKVKGIAAMSKFTLVPQSRSEPDSAPTDASLELEAGHHQNHHRSNSPYTEKPRNNVHPTPLHFFVAKVVR